MKAEVLHFLTMAADGAGLQHLTNMTQWDRENEISLFGLSLKKAVSECSVWFKVQPCSVMESLCDAPPVTCACSGLQGGAPSPWVQGYGSFCGPSSAPAGTLSLCRPPWGPAWCPCWSDPYTEHLRSKNEPLLGFPKSTWGPEQPKKAKTQ